MRILYEGRRSVALLLGCLGNWGFAGGQDEAST